MARDSHVNGYYVPAQPSDIHEGGVRHAYAQCPNG